MARKSRMEELSVVADPWNLKLKRAKVKGEPFPTKPKGVPFPYPSEENHEIP